MNQEQGNLLFTFAVISDTHLVVPEHAGQALHSTHSLSSDRLRYLVNILNQTRPAFIIHLGDMIHPVPGSPDYGSTAKSFFEIAADLKSPLYIVPGNHDIGDKYRDGMPAAVVSPKSVAEYQRNFGDSYRTITHQDCSFILINNPILNSGLGLEFKQHQWLEAELEKKKGERIFLMMHYPVYLMDPDEVEHYDNLDQPSRAMMLRVVAKYGVEAVFAGHVHNFFYNKVGQTDLYAVPSTAFVRQDYSEMFRVEPTEGYGRNDLDKLGYFAVSIYERGHHVRFVRTGGRTVESRPSARLQPAAAVPEISLLAHQNAPIGVELRHDWNEVTQIPFNYILDEFVRRKVRNDYPILAMWELGIQKVRVPLSDLLDPDSRERISLLYAKGFQFTIFSSGFPKGDRLNAVFQNSHLIHALEVIVTKKSAPDVVGRIVLIKNRAPFKVILSFLAHTQEFSGSIDQYIRPGSRIQAIADIKLLLANDDVANNIDGFTFRIGPDENPWETITGIEILTEELGLFGSVIVQLASDSEAGIIDDDYSLASRVAIAAAAAFVATQVDVFIDTFMDMDRGYYIRHGLVDRRYNLRLSGNVLQNMSAALPRTRALGYAHGHLKSDGQYYQWLTDQYIIVLVVCPRNGECNLDLSFPALNKQEGVGVGIRHELCRGKSNSVTWQIVNANMAIRSGVPFGGLSLLVLAL